MNNQLEKNCHQIVRGFMNEDRASSLYKDFMKFNHLYRLAGDSQVPRSSALYNYLPAIEVLTHSTQKISEIVKESLLPAYSYSRIYKNKAELKRHIDRNSCEVSVTLHLGGDMPWDIWIQPPKQEARPVSLQPGDAMIYLGVKAPHWRKPYEGNHYAQFFLHYVRTYGNLADYFFDTGADYKMTISMIKKFNSGAWKQ